MRYLIDLAIPLLLLVLAATGKWVMAGGSWDPEFARLGPDLLLGGFGAELAFLTGLGRRLLASPTTVVPADIGRRLVICSLFVVVTVVFLTVAWASHKLPPPPRRGAPRPVRRWTPRTAFTLLFAWNAVGVGVLVVFLALVQTD